MMEDKLNALIKYIIVRDIYEGIRKLTDEELKHKGWSKNEELKIKLRNARQVLLKRLSDLIGFDIENQFTYTSAVPYHVSKLDKDLFDGMEEND